MVSNCSSLTDVYKKIFIDNNIYPVLFRKKSNDLIAKKSGKRDTHQLLCNEVISKMSLKEKKGGHTFLSKLNNIFK